MPQLDPIRKIRISRRMQTWHGVDPCYFVISFDGTKILSMKVDLKDAEGREWLAEIVSPGTRIHVYYQPDENYPYYCVSYLYEGDEWGNTFEEESRGFVEDSLDEILFDREPERSIPWTPIETMSVDFKGTHYPDDQLCFLCIQAFIGEVELIWANVWYSTDHCFLHHAVPRNASLKVTIGGDNGVSIPSFSVFYLLVVGEDGPTLVPNGVEITGQRDYLDDSGNHLVGIASIKNGATAVEINEVVSD